MKKTSTFYDKKISWDGFFATKETSWRHKDYTFLESIFDVSAFEGTLLDAGCGLGDGILYLSDKCNKVTKFYGIDFSGVAIKKCINNSKLSHVNFFQHDVLEKLQERYDTVICLQTLEHLSDPIKAVRNLIEATNKLLIISTSYKNMRKDKDHLWSFDENDFVDLLSFYCIAQKRKKNIYWTWRA